LGRPSFLIPPDPVDRHVGERIRERRRELGLSQEQLARAVAVSVQQLQKYERATNRVSASKLFEIAQVLRVAPSRFFDGAHDVAPPPRIRPYEGPERTLRALPHSPEWNELTQAFQRLGAHAQRRIIELIRGLADAEEADRRAQTAPETGLDPPT
jgi:transcriptional regulator with XRE-family HTH domain